MYKSLLTVIIPCYNEALSLTHIISDLIDYCNNKKWHIIFINDNSKDDTLDILKKHSKYKNNVKVVNHKVHKGYGGAIKSGIIVCETEYIATIDADGQHSIQDIDRLYNRCVFEDADMVIGSRVGLPSASILRGIGKAIIRMVAKILLPNIIYDINSGMKIFKTDMGKKYISLLPDNMAFSEIIVLVFINQKLKVLEEQISIRNRIAGVSNINIYTAFSTLSELINIVTFFNPLRIFLPISLCFSILGISWGLIILFNGKGLSVGASFLIIMGVLTFLIGLLSEQVANLRKQIIELQSSDNYQ